MNENTEQSEEKSLLERPDELLAGIASATWQAYNAMEATKSRHFWHLEVLDNKKKNYNLDPNEREAWLLSCLLRDHDEQVQRFSAASQVLKAENAEAHLALFTYIGSINQTAAQQSLAH